MALIDITENSSAFFAPVSRKNKHLILVNRTVAIAILSTHIWFTFLDTPTLKTTSTLNDKIFRTHVAPPL